MSESDAAGEWEQGNGERIRKIVMRWWERSWKMTGEFGDEEDNGWGYGRGPSRCSGGIGRRGIGSDNALGDGRSGMLGDSAGEWTGEGLESYLRSTKTLLVEGHVLHQIPRERTRLRCWKRKFGRIGR